MYGADQSNTMDSCSRDTCRIFAFPVPMCSMRCTAQTLKGTEHISACHQQVLRSAGVAEAAWFVRFLVVC
uniref:Uncharacterized protein n=1 Tax=Tanacetum cinerariifolium TaxID=118510 RepID=A0A699X6F7_TANCI|nr:hypothetical protein [Tanacetum cinerariifolium]